MRILVLLILISLGTLAKNIHDFTIVPGLRVGKITEKTTRKDLGRFYGEKNIKDKVINVGDEYLEMAQVSFLFSNDCENTTKIIWKSKKMREVKRIIITGSKSKWKFSNGIRIGTRLKELEKLNGKPFYLYGFSWDGSGLVTTFEDGALWKYFMKASVSFSFAKDKKYTSDEKLFKKVDGGKERSSRDKFMQKVNPYIYKIVIIFRKKTEEEMAPKMKSPFDF